MRTPEDRFDWQHERNIAIELQHPGCNTGCGGGDLFYPTHAVDCVAHGCNGTLMRNSEKGYRQCRECGRRFSERLFQRLKKS